MSAKDISRFLCQPGKRYSSVRMQQGRVILDSDWNESECIDDEEARRILAETVCAKGTPNEGFLVQEATEATVTEPPVLGEEFPPTKGTYDFALASGSFYLGGLRFEIVPEIAERFLSQTDWLQIDADLANLPVRPSVEDLTNEDSTFRVRADLVYLRGWEQCVTAVEDSELLERALAVDTSARIYRSRRIEVLPDVPLVGRDFCAEAFDRLKVQLAAPREGDGPGEPHLFDDANCELRSKATLTVTFGGQGITDDPCKPTVTAGFLGAENQTIRVQLTATNRFIWGYDNASPFYRVQVLEEKGQPVKIMFLTLPRDQVAQPLKGQAVEILPWSAFLPNQEKVAELQGHLATVATSFNPEEKEKTITISKPVPQAWIDWLNAPAHAQYLSERDPDDKKKYFYLRLWTGGSGDAGEPDHAFTPGTPVELQGTGLNVTFSKHGLPGDFWIIAARPNTPDLVVPWDLMEEAPPAGTRFFFAPLALVRWTVAIPPAGGEVSVRATVQDCRHKFRPLCEVTDDFTHICAINWVHPTPSLDNPTNNITPIDNLNRDGVLIAFDRPVLNGDIHRHSFMVLDKRRNQESGTECWCELRISRVGGVRFEKDCEILSGFEETNDPNAAVNGAQFRPERDFRPNQEYRVVLKGDFIRDAKNKKGIDADHLPPWLPECPTGDGTEGGTFESWFVTVAPQVPAKVIRVQPPNGAEFNSSGEALTIPPPPPSIDILFDKRLQGATVNENTVRVVRSSEGGPAVSWPGTVDYDDMTRTARFIPQESFGTGPATIRIYTLTLFGDGSNRILDEDGLALDGNSDDSPGGDFTSTFTVFHIIG
jgi:hypothetical protein